MADGHTPFMASYPRKMDFGGLLYFRRHFLVEVESRWILRLALGDKPLEGVRGSG